jgi:hypothetical protein
MAHRGFVDAEGHGDLRLVETVVGEDERLVLAQREAGDPAAAKRHDEVVAPAQRVRGVLAHGGGLHGADDETAADCGFGLAIATGVLSVLGLIEHELVIERDVGAGRLAPAQEPLVVDARVIDARQQLFGRQHGDAVGVGHGLDSDPLEQGHRSSVLSAIAPLMFYDATP